MALGLSVSAQASEYRLLDLDSFDFRAAKFTGNRDPITPDIPVDGYRGRLATQFQVRLFEVGYWKNYVHTEGTDAKVETVGWQWEIGVRISKQLSTYWEHHSRHRMDAETPGKFPVEDSFGFALRVYTNPRPQRSLFQ
jgi:hypothetical protein